MNNSIINESIIASNQFQWLNYRVALNFFRALIFAIFAVFFAIRKNKFPQNKITANFFSAKIYSTVEIIYKNTGLKEKMP